MIIDRYIASEIAKPMLMATATLVLIFVTKAVTSLRVDEETEVNGLDLSVHGERAYDHAS